MCNEITSLPFFAIEEEIIAISHKNFISQNYNLVTLRDEGNGYVNQNEPSSHRLLTAVVPDLVKDQTNQEDTKGVHESHPRISRDILWVSRQCKK